MDPLVRKWDLFFQRALAYRASTSLFDKAATQLHSESPIAGRKIAALLLRPRSAGSKSIDPRVMVYCERLFALRKIDASDILASAIEYSRDRPPRAGDGETASKDDSSRWFNPPELEEVLFDRLHHAFSTGRRPVSSAEALRTIAIISKWMNAMVASHTSESMIQAMAGIQQHPQPQSISIRDGLGMLVVSLIENVKILELLRKEQAKDIRKAFVQSLSNFIPFLSQTSLNISNRLELSQKEHDFYDKSLTNINGDAGENNGLEVAAIQLDAVMDLPVMNTRAGLYIFLNSLLTARPLADDFAILSYLHSRYRVNSQDIAADLITAAFDVLANALYRGESSETMLCLKCFLINKVPLLLIQLATTPFTAELCITQALGHIDPTAFPHFSQGFDELLGNNNNSLSDVRQDFVNACALHGLIPTNAVQRLLGEPPMQGPPDTRYNRKDLLAQCKENFERVNVLIDELENLDGNAGAIVGALTEFISHLCETQMTMYLTTISNLLSKRPQALHVMLQFTSPSSILRSLCQFLDEWRYEETQGEYQPVYDEFGAILVLILAFVHRFDLTYHDLGIGHDSFVAQLLEHGHHSIPLDRMTEEQGRHLRSWIKGLYDSEKEALGNDVFASCRPQDFYLIVPTLFSQTIKACSAGVLSLDTVKGGLEYLHNTFLLPSLVGGLTWMTSHALKQTHGDLDMLIQVFHKLIRSGPSSGDAQAMHSTILSILSSRLEKCFQTLKRRNPNNTDIDLLLQAIKPNLNYERSVYSSMSELEQWTSSSPGTLSAALRHTIQQLTIWASGGSVVHSHPPGYSHRLLYASLQILGVSQTLDTILSEVQSQTSSGNGATALDIAVSLISAPTTANSALPVDNDITAPSYPRTHTNLREMLKAFFENAASLYLTNPLYAETIVRLHRRVEAQFLAFSQGGALSANQHHGLQMGVGVGVGGLPDITNSMIDVQHTHATNGHHDSELDKALNEAAAASIAAVGGADLHEQQEQQALQRSLDQQLDMSAGAGLDLGLGGMGEGMGGGMAGDMGMGLDLGLGVDGVGGMDLGEDDNDWGLDFEGM